MRGSVDTANRTDRRTFLKKTGACSVLAAGLAGCVGTEGNGDGNGATPTDEPTDGDTMDGTTTEMAGPERVLIGQPASLTGQWDFLQPAVSQSTDLAVQEINEAGGPLDATFEVQRRDTAVDPQQARQVVRQLVDSDEVHAIAHV